jgi:signal transduction histidine kinase
LVVRRTLGAHPFVTDALAAVVLCVAALVAAHGPGYRPVDAFAVALVSLMSLPLALRRPTPMTVLVVSATALLIYEIRGYPPGVNALCTLFALASLASRRSRRWIVAGAVLVAPGMLYNQSTVDGAVLGTVWIVAFGVAGDAVRRIREHTAVAVENAARLRAEQRDREQRAVLEERIHIARELHDVVAHHMSVIAVQAGLARYVLATDPPTAESALRAVADMSSDGLAEVRRLVTVLRPNQDNGGREDQDGQDTPGVEELPTLIERVGLTGVAIEFTISGSVRPLPAGVGLCLYRVVQESLTNAIKHARGARVTAFLHYEPDQVTIRITNSERGGPPDADAPRPPGGRLRLLGGDGKGLTGMYERAMLYGGTLTAGGLPDGGFEVVLSLPIRAPEQSPEVPSGAWKRS